MDVVYQSFEGRFSDNPRAIYAALRDRPGVRHLWLQDPAQAATFPAGIKTVTYGSPESIEALEAADLIVANTHTDLPWRKKPGATYLQTWHGTPLKRIHWDVLWAPEGRLARLQEDVDQWDLLISPNAVSTPRMRQAFRYDREVLEVGYPRNDLLCAPEREEVRARVRRELDIPDGVTAILYTPTWRDDFVFSDDAGDYVLDLDVEAFDRALGGDQCLLLRTHYMLTGRLAAAGLPSVRDVSLHPEVAELYLAADAMVTDYSSTMFDFAVTGKPMAFYAYDLDDYRDRQRGFYFDFLPEAPGPVVTTNAELLDELADVDGMARRYEGAYAAFRERYCHLEDGRAAERVVARIAGGS